MLIKYTDLKKLCDNITAGFSVQPKIETGKVFPTGNDRVGASCKLNHLILELSGSMIGGGQNSMFIYRWDLANSFCVSPDIDFARHLESLKFGCDVTVKQNSCFGM